MTEQLLPATHTILDAEATYATLRSEWLCQVRSEPPRAALLVLLAQVWLETGNGHASFGWNLAGIKHFPGDGHDYYEVPTHEDDAEGRETTIVAAFRAYPDLAAAAHDYVALLRGHFPDAIAAALAGDTAGYAHALSARGYYTAPEATYARALASRYALLQSAIGEQTSPATPVALTRRQPPPGTDDDDQPTPPEDLERVASPREDTPPRGTPMPKPPGAG